MGCFGGSEGGGQQIPKLTKEQKELVALLARQAGPAIEAVTGATIPGQEFAPGGPSPLQQQAFGLAGQLPGQMQFDPSRIAEQFEPVAEFARRGFQEETIPAIAQAAGFEGGARSTGFQNILARQGMNLELGLAGQLGQQQIGAFQQAQQRTMQMPGMLAGIGGLQASFPEAQRQFGLEQFRAAAPEADPRLGFVGPAFTSAFDTAAIQGQQGLGPSLVGAAGMLGAAKIAFGCIKEGTVVDCPDCKKLIEDVRAGDMIYDKTGRLSVVRWKNEYMDEPTEDRFIELVFEGDVKIICSDMHKIDGLRAMDLKIGDNGLLSKTVVPMSGRSYDLLTSGTDGSYRSNGINIDSMIPELLRKAG